MKTIFLVFSACILLSANGMAQGLLMSAPITTVVVTDTLHYFYNKHYFKTADPLTSFPFYKSPAATTTLITHVGSFFENNEPLDISGLEGFASRNKWAVANVPVHLYLCNVGVGGMPQMPPVDSVVANVTNTVMSKVGGTLVHGVRKISGNYYVLIRNMSTHDGDTANLLRTAGMTNTSSAQPKFRISEGYGVVRNFGQFNAATNFTGLGFGIGTDYEICVAPIVQYTLNIGHDKPWETILDDTLICAFEQIKFKSTCSKRISHRMHNLIEFRRRWDNNPPFDPAALSGTNLPGDSAGITWHFLPEDNRNYYLPANSTNGEVIFYTDSAQFKNDGVTPDTTCFDGNEFRVRHHGMNINGGKNKYSYTETFKLCTEACIKGDGFWENSMMANVILYPSPVINGKLTISGLRGENKLTAFNVLGQQVMINSTDSSEIEVDLVNQPQGSYVLKVYNSQGSKLFKIIKQ